MHEASDILTSPDDSPRSECCNAVMVWIECENCDGKGYHRGAFEDVDCVGCLGDGGEWTCPSCQQ